MTEPLCEFFTGLEKPQNQAHCSTSNSKDANVVPGSVKSFADFQKSKGKEWKERVSKKNKGAKGKKVDQRGASSEREVIIFIGLVEWNESSECLKRKHGKRMALKVNKVDPPVVLLQKAVEEWKAYFSNYFDQNEDYVLLLEDYKEATFLPGPGKEFFTLERYQEELGKDFKRITLFLVH